MQDFALDLAGHIYVLYSGIDGPSLETFTSNGAPTTPNIKDVNAGWIAVDANGKSMP